MDPAVFREEGKRMVDFIADYWESIPDRPVLPSPSIKPDYLSKLLPTEAPDDPESLTQVLKDVEDKIFPGITQWQHPHFFSYYPTACSGASLMGDMLSSAIAVIGFSWASSPACTDLEKVMMNWLAKMLNLPEEFLYKDGSPGGGVIQGTASEATVLAMLGARAKKLRSLSNGEGTEGAIDRMVCYTSDLAHSSVDKGAAITYTPIHSVVTNDRGSMTGEALEAAILDDLSAGKIPYCVVATIGTTSMCTHDDIESVGEVCKKYNLWLHVDAAYAGSALMCPEFAYLGKGIELSDSFNMNPHKWMRVVFDCSALWMKDCTEMAEAFITDPLYLRHKHSGNKSQDLRNLQLPLGRRFRSLKMWFTFRLHGVKSLQEYIRKQCNLAKLFASLVATDDRYEVVNDVSLGLVCFRLKAGNEQTRCLVNLINEKDRRIHLVPSQWRDMYFARFCVASGRTEEEHVRFAWKVIGELTPGALAMEE